MMSQNMCRMVGLKRQRNGKEHCLKMTLELGNKLKKEFTSNDLNSQE